MRITRQLHAHGNRYIITKGALPRTNMAVENGPERNTIFLYKQGNHPLPR